VRLTPCLESDNPMLISTIDACLDCNLVLSSSDSFGKYSALPDKMQLASRKYPCAGSDVDQDVQWRKARRVNMHMSITSLLIRDGKKTVSLHNNTQLKVLCSGTLYFM
jgi:hypothetical protein